MKTGEVADRLGVSTQTVRNWKEEWREYLSPHLLNSGSGQPLIFYERDVRVLATVAACKEQQFTTEDIKRVLEDEANWVDVPPLPSPAEEAARASVQLVPLSEYRREIRALTDERDRLAEERDKARQKLEEAQGRIEELKETVGKLTGELETRRAMTEKDESDTKSLTEEIIKLNRQIAVLEFKLELQGANNDKGDQES